MIKHKMFGVRTLRTTSTPVAGSKTAGIDSLLSCRMNGGTSAFPSVPSGVDGDSFMFTLQRQILLN